VDRESPPCTCGKAKLIDAMAILQILLVVCPAECLGPPSAFADCFGSLLCQSLADRCQAILERDAVRFTSLQNLGGISIHGWRPEK